jgi:hypothetical protein
MANSVQAHDYRDLALEHLAADEAALRARVRSLEADVLAYRALSQQTIHALASVTRHRDRQRDELHRLREENRWLRGELMRRDDTGRAA